jgi:hypothetical protein
LIREILLLPFPEQLLEKDRNCHSNSLSQPRGPLQTLWHRGALAISVFALIALLTLWVGEYRFESQRLPRWSAVGDMAAMSLKSLVFGKLHAATAFVPGAEDGCYVGIAEPTNTARRMPSSLESSLRTRLICRWRPSRRRTFSHRLESVIWSGQKVQADGRRGRGIYRFGLKTLPRLARCIWIAEYSAVIGC